MTGGIAATQAAANNSQRPALLYRTRLAAARRQVPDDVLAIDPWHLAAVLEGLRLAWIRRCG